MLTPTPAPAIWRSRTRCIGPTATPTAASMARWWRRGRSRWGIGWGERANSEWRMASSKQLAEASYSLLATRYSLLATRYSLLATRYSLLATLYSLLSTLFSRFSVLFSVLSTLLSPISESLAWCSAPGLSCTCAFLVTRVVALLSLVV